MVADVCVGGVSREGVVGHDVKTVDVPAIGVGLVEDRARAVAVEGEGRVPAVRYGLGDDPALGDDETLGEGAGEVVVLLVGDGAPEGDLDLHEVGPVVERGEVQALRVRDVPQLVHAEVLENVVHVRLQLVQSLAYHLHCCALEHAVYPPVVVVALTKVGEEPIPTRYYTSLEVDLLVV